MRKEDDNNDGECAKDLDDNSKDAVCPLCHKCSDLKYNLENHMLKFHNYVSTISFHNLALKIQNKIYECWKRTLWQCSQRICVILYRIYLGAHYSWLWCRLVEIRPTYIPKGKVVKFGHSFDVIPHFSHCSSFRNEFWMAEWGWNEGMKQKNLEWQEW